MAIYVAGLSEQLAPEDSAPLEMGEELPDKWRKESFGVLKEQMNNALAVADTPPPDVDGAIRSAIGVGEGVTMTGAPQTGVVEVDSDMNNNSGGLVGKIEQKDAVKSVFNSLLSHEGAEGDTTGAAETGKLGVTTALRKRLKIPASMKDEDVAKKYLNIIYDKMSPEMKEAPPIVVKTLMDSAYNMGEGMLKYNGINAAVKAGDWLGVGRNLLDTASIAGQASKGLAVRRAKHYNQIANELGEPTIKHVEQKADGTLVYTDEDGETIFKYRPKGGRHESSKAGVATLEVPKSSRKVEQVVEHEGQQYNIKDGKLVPVIAKEEIFYDDEGTRFRMVNGQPERIA